MAPHLAAVTRQEIAGLGERLGSPRNEPLRVGPRLWRTRPPLNETTAKQSGDALRALAGPAVILVGHPYAAFAPEVNLSIPARSPRADLQ